MIARRATLFRAIWLAAFALCGSTLVSAQLSTSLSQPLDTNLNGLGSSVAPVPSTEIAPGAGDLLVSDPRLLPLDSIGASIDSTLMSPSRTQFNLTYSPYWIDTAVKEVTTVTGKFIQSPFVITDFLERRGGSNSFTIGPAAPASSFMPLPTLTGQASARAVMSSGSAQQRMTLQQSGAVPSALSVIHPRTPALSVAYPQALPAQQSAPPSKSEKPETHQHIGTGMASGKRSTPATNARTVTQDFSRSPLEGFGQLEESDTTSNPFQGFGETSFLNPDITQVTSRRRRTGGVASTYTGSQSASSDLVRPDRFAQPGHPISRDRMSNGRNFNDRNRDFQSTRKQSRTSQSTGARWHNPVLQQMEGESGSQRQ